MNWPNYIVWNETQKAFVDRFAHDPKNILVVGDLLFDSETDIMINHGKIVAVLTSNRIEPSFMRYRLRLLSSTIQRIASSFSQTSRKSQFLSHLRCC